MKRLTEEKKNEIIGIILIITGLIFTLNLFIEEAGPFGAFFESFFELFLGRLGIFLIPLLLLYSGYLLIRFKTIDFGIRILGIFLIILTLLTVFPSGHPPRGRN